jgi:hypothetical protein
MRKSSDAHALFAGARTKTGGDLVLRAYAFRVVNGRERMRPINDNGDEPRDDDDDDDDGGEAVRVALARVKTKLKTLRLAPVNETARSYNAALDEVEKFVASLLPPPPPVETKEEAEARKQEEDFHPELQEEWDTKVLAWADELDSSITLDKAILKLAPYAKSGSAVRKAIEGALKRLPRDRYTISWYMNGDHLAPSWAKKPQPVARK